MLFFSDIHYSNHFDKSILDSLYKTCLNNEPQYILIPGDILDFSLITNNYEHRNILFKFLKGLAQIAPVLISYGNHDLFDKNTTYTKSSWKDSDVAGSFLEALNLFHNIYFLDNTCVEFSNNVFVGYNPKENFKYYEEFKGEKDHFVDSINKELVLPNISDDTFNTFLIHDPNHINDVKSYNNIPILSKADLMVSGHNHNGLLPAFTTSLPLTGGLVDARMQLFSKYVRGFSKIENTYSLISGGVTKLAEGVTFGGIDISKFNQLYASNIDIIDIQSKTLVKK